MLKEQDALNMKSPSPVAPFSKKRNWQSRLLMLAAGIVIIGGMVLQHYTRVESEPVDDESGSMTVLIAPKITTSEQKLNKIKETISKQQSVQLTDDRQEQEGNSAEKLEKMRMVAPTTVYSSFSHDAQTRMMKSGGKPENGVLGGIGSRDSNIQFISQISNNNVPFVYATHIAHPATTLAQGTMIWATLETRIASDLPGMTRAVSSKDIYSEDGTQLLLPKGSRLIGQYTNAITNGQQRVFVVWQRIIRPDHISIQLNSAGTDALGAAGIGGDSIDRHFLEQFGTAALLSIISAGSANSDVSSQDQFNSASAYREALSSSFAQSAQNILRATGTINPSLYINQGKAISVFVSRDLDFEKESNQVQS